MEHLGELSDMIDDQHTVADIIFSAFEGSSIYKIYDTEDLKNRMFPYRENGMVPQEYYRTIYGILFNGVVSQTELQKEAVLGKKLAEILLRKKLEEEKIANMEKIYLVLQGSTTVEDSTITTKIGNKIEMIFTDVAAKNYSDFIKEAFEKDKKIVLWYQDLETDSRKSITLEVDKLGSTDGFYPLYFNAQTTKFQPISISYFDDDLGGYTTFDFRIGSHSRFDVRYDKSTNETNDKENSTQNATKIAKKIGNHLISIKEIDYSSSSGFLIGDNLFIVEKYGIRVMDVSDKKDPKLITDFSLGGRGHNISAKLNYPYIFFQYPCCDVINTRIIDISDPQNLNLVEVNETKEIKNRIKTFYQGYAYTDRGEIFDVSDLNDIVKLENMDVNLTNIQSMKVSAKYPVAYTYGYAYTGGYRPYKLVFKTLSLRDPASPVSLGTIIIEDYTLYGDIAIADNYAIVVADRYASGKYGLLFFDISDEDNPKIEKFYPLDFRPNINMSDSIYIKVENDLLYISDYDSIKIYDIKDVSNIKKINDIPLLLSEDKYNGGSFTVEKGFLYAVGEAILQIFDISNPTIQNEHYFNSYKTKNLYPHNPYIISKKGDYIYIEGISKLKKTEDNKTKWLNGFNIIDLRDKSNPKYRFIETENSSSYSKIYKNYLFARGSGKTIVYDISNPTNMREITTIDGSNLKFVGDRYIVIGNKLYEQK
jgi:hypothetical protein